MKTKNYSNKMLFIILTILILLCIIYLYLKNKGENKGIEGFTDYNLVPQSTQQSLSIYAVNPMDSDTRGINYDNTKFNSTGKTQDSRAYGWNGYWISNDNNYYMSVLQINDVLILSINNINISNNNPYTNIKKNSDNTFKATTTSGSSVSTTINCPLNNFTAQFQLNYNRKKFYIKDIKNIYCNTIGNIFNNFGGYIDRNNIIIPDKNITFNRDTKMNNSYDNVSATYSLTQTKLINPYPKLPASTLTYNSSNTSYNNKNTFMPINILSQYITNNNNNNYKLCSLINNINNNNKTKAYIFYINDFINVQSLDYNFYGIGKDDSNLTLKNTNLAFSIFNKIKKNQNYKYIFQQMTSYIYCSERDDKNLKYIDESTNFFKDYSNKDKVLSNKKTPVLPILWNISSGYKSSTCYISLSSLPDKNNTIKYPQFNSDGSINMTINDGGTNQELIFEDINTIKTDENYFISTGYFRTNDLLYMVSNNTNKTLQGDNTVKLVSKPSPTAKWVIVGFNDKSNINNIIDSSF